MCTIKLKFQIISIIMLSVLIIALIGNQYVFAQETCSEVSTYADNENQGVSVMSSFESDGLTSFGIESDPFSGGTHTGETRQIMCAAQIDVSEFSHRYTDYIVINWDNEKYRIVENSEVIYCYYYLDFFGEVDSVERICHFAEVKKDGVREVAIELEDHIWIDGWKWAEVTEIYCFIFFELEKVNEEVQTEIYANYYHCTKQTEISAISVSPDGTVTLHWDTDEQYSPIWGDSDYIWE